MVKWLFNLYILGVSQLIERKWWTAIPYVCAIFLALLCHIALTVGVL